MFRFLRKLADSFRDMKLSEKTRFFVFFSYTLELIADHFKEVFSPKKAKKNFVLKFPCVSKKNTCLEGNFFNFEFFSTFQAITPSFFMNELASFK